MFPRNYFDLYRPHISEKTVFVGMPFTERASRFRKFFNSIRCSTITPSPTDRWKNVIRPAIEDAGLDPYRVDMDVPSDSILENIMRGILDAKFLLFDISIVHYRFRNGNVMYEIGIAHAMRHPEEILIIRSDNDPLLFDVSSIRIHTLDFQDREKARAQLGRLLRHLADNMTSLKTIILDKVRGSLDEVCLGLLASHANFSHFSLTDSSKAFEPETVAGRSAIRHLLDQGVLSLIWKKEEYKYAYVWTYMGIALLKYLGFLTGQKPEPGQQLYNYQGAQRVEDSETLGE